MPEVSVFINKRIPPGSGLGGGSSDVAVVLKAVNEMLGKPLTDEELKEVALSVSSDAPFFFLGGTAVGRGRGELLEPVEDLNLKLTLVIPEVRASTRRVYSALKEEHFSEPPPLEEILSALRSGDTLPLRNVLGEVACEMYPEIGEVVRFLRDLGLEPLVSGSGSAVFYIGGVTPEVEMGSRLRGWRVLEVKSWLGA